MNKKLNLLILSVFILLAFGCSTNKSSVYFNIIDYGAVGDGVTLNTEAIQSAVDACAGAGGGKVILPSGKYLSGTIVLKSNVELHFEQNATLLASTRHEDFPMQPLPEYRSLKDQMGGFFALIYAEGASNISITGNGTIDGQGKLQEPRKEQVARDIDGRPRNLMLISCKNVLVEGIHFRNSGIWNQHYLNCEDVKVDKISVYNHSNRNNDGIDIDGCRRFVLSNSILDSDDDCITLKSTGPAACEDIVITNCVASSYCNAIKAGTESSGGFRNITISNCVVKPSRSETKPIFETPETGITGLSLMIVDGGVMEGISVDNLTIYGTMAPIYIRLGNRARKYSADAPQPAMGVVRNISINNVVAYGAGEWGSSITGQPGFPVENITLSNIQQFTKGDVKKGMFNESVKKDPKGYPQPTTWKTLPASGFFIRHAKGISFNNIVLGVGNKDERPPFVADNVSELQISNVRLSGPYKTDVFVSGKDIADYDIKKPMGWNGRRVVKVKR